MPKHSNVFYVFRGEAGFEAVEKARACRNTLGIDLFRHNGSVYEGRTGCTIMSVSDLPKLTEKIESSGGVEKLNEKIEAQIKRAGESPRYTRPDERKIDIFPPYPEKENIVYSEDIYGKKHYFFRFEYEGIELFTLKKQTDFFRQVFVECNGYMFGVDKYHRLEEIKKWLDGLENGVIGEVERVFNECMADPTRWADIGYARILGRIDEANAHNAPIREAREQENKLRDAEYEAQRQAQEQANKEKYEKAIKNAETMILNRERVVNEDIQNRSLIMQLFRENNISVPLKTQGWIINSLLCIQFNEEKDCWSYRYNGNKSTVFFDYLDKLIYAIQQKHDVNASE